MDAARSSIKTEFAPAPFGAIKRRNGIAFYDALTSTGERIFVKILDLKNCDELFRKRFAREIIIANTLTHASITRLHASGDHWFASEYLETALDMPSISILYFHEVALANLLLQIAELLAYIHSRGVAHGDIKPAHIRFRNGHPVLVDFGIACVGFQDKLNGVEIIGTPRWMSPEQICRGIITPECDIWSFCALGLWLLTGRLPRAETPEEILTKCKGMTDHAFCDQRSGKSSWLANLLSSGLAEPSRRPKARDFVRALRNVPLR